MKHFRRNIDVLYIFLNWRKETVIIWKKFLRTLKNEKLCNLIQRNGRVMEASITLEKNLNKILENYLWKTGTLILPFFVTFYIFKISLKILYSIEKFDEKLCGVIGEVVRASRSWFRFKFCVRIAPSATENRSS